MSDLWKGLRAEARAQLAQRDYGARSLAERVASCGVETAELLGAQRAELGWIPGVEIFAREILPQRHRGFLGEFARQDSGTLGRIGFWPRQWASARMFAHTAKGFHIHPPHVPDGEEPARWFQRLFNDPSENFSLRPYAHEQ